MKKLHAALTEDLAIYDKIKATPEAYARAVAHIDSVIAKVYGKGPIADEVVEMAWTAAAFYTKGQLQETIDAVKSLLYTGAMQNKLLGLGITAEDLTAVFNAIPVIGATWQKLDPANLRKEIAENFSWVEMLLTHGKFPAVDAELPPVPEEVNEVENITPEEPEVIHVPEWDKRLCWAVDVLNAAGMSDAADAAVITYSAYLTPVATLPIEAIQELVDNLYAHNDRVLLGDVLAWVKDADIGKLPVSIPIVKPNRMVGETKWSVNFDKFTKDDYVAMGMVPAELT